jgi:hypothetical protein
MLNLLLLVVFLSFVVFRVVRFLRYDTLFDPVRDRFWQLFPPTDLALKYKPRGDSVPLAVNGDVQYVSANGSFIGELTSCVWCLSAYVSAGVTVVSQFAGAPLHVLGLRFLGWVLVWLATWGFSCILLSKYSY